MFYLIYRRIVSQIVVGSEEQRALGFNELMSKISPETKDWWENTVSITPAGSLGYTILTA